VERAYIQILLIHDMTEVSGFGSVAIENFRGIAAGEIKDFSKINVLPGKFTAGKSTYPMTPRCR